MSQFSIFESTESIHLPVHRVWELLTDWVAAPLWMPSVESMHADDPQHRVGTTLSLRMQGRERQMEIYEQIEHRLLVLHTSANPDGLSYRFDLLPDADRTEVVLQVSVINPDLSMEECSQLAEEVSRTEGAMLTRLKQYCEKAP